VIVFLAGVVTASAVLPSTAPAGGDVYLVCRAPVADLRRDPQPPAQVESRRPPYPSDGLEETQLLYGERVRRVSEEGGWVRVEAVEQAEFTHQDRWEGYPGWVRREDLAPEPPGFATNAVVVPRQARVHAARGGNKGTFLPMGARVQVLGDDGAWARLLSPEGKEMWMPLRDLARDPGGAGPVNAGEIRRRVTVAARSFVGVPYWWGGRGLREREVPLPSGVDCSGLVNVAFRAAGVAVPRDAHEQYMKARPLMNGAALQPGDLVFLAKADAPERMTHVMVSLGGEKLLEASGDAHRVRVTSGVRKLGARLRSLSTGHALAKWVVHFGQLVPADSR
jgi:hypothetical protein